ncbi:MAG: type IV pilin protein [Bacillota bacterium]
MNLVSSIRKGHVRKGHLTGFTLIELLVVIAIIGILSSVVLASLNTARAKGADAAIKSNIDNARAQAELYYDNGQTYLGVCAAASSATPGGIATMKSGATAAGASQVYCADSATSWILAANLKTGGSFCADNTGTSTYKSITVPSSGATATSCNVTSY